MAKKVLKARDIERLENTSVASALIAAAGLDVEAHHMHDGGCNSAVSCIGVSCDGAGASICTQQGTVCSVGSPCCTGCTACSGTTCAGCTAASDVCVVFSIG